MGIRVKFSVRTLLLVFTCGILCLGVFGARLHQSRVQKTAARDLRGSGYKLYYDFQAELPNRPEVAVVGPNSDRQARSQRWFDFAKRGPPTRNWPFSLLPDDFFHSVVLAQVNRSPEVNASRLTQLRNLQWLSIYRTPITKPDWKNIGKLKTLKVLLIWPAKLDNEGPKSIAALRELEQLTLQGPGITDSDIQCVCGLEKLVFLSLAGSLVSDEGLGRLLGTLPELQCIDLSGTRVTGEGVAQRSKSPNVEFLSVKGANVSNDGLRNLLQIFPNLKRLDMSQTQVTDDGLAHLPSSKRLESLILSDLPVDSGLRHLFGIAGLQHLDLSFSDASDSGILHIHRLHSLQWLNVECPYLSEEGVKELRRALPDCEVIW